MRKLNLSGGSICIHRREEQQHKITALGPQCLPRMFPCFYNLSHRKHAPNVDEFYTERCVASCWIGIFQIPAMNSPIQSNCTFNWIFPCGPFLGSQPLWHTNYNQGQRSTRRAGWLLTTGFRNSAVPSHCCWQEISARHWCAEQELIWSGLLQLKGTGPEVVHSGGKWG